MRGVWREMGSRSRASYFSLVCLTAAMSLPSERLAKLTDRQKDRQTDTLFQHGVSSTFFLRLTKRRVSATPSDVNRDTEVLQINVNLFAFLCFRRNCPICRHPLFSQDSQ